MNSQKRGQPGTSGDKQCPRFKSTAGAGYSQSGDAGTADSTLYKKCKSKLKRPHVHTLAQSHGWRGFEAWTKVGTGRPHLSPL